jgi:hypothetical protein
MESLMFQIHTRLIQIAHLLSTFLLKIALEPMPLRIYGQKQEIMISMIL